MAKELHNGFDGALNCQTNTVNDGNILAEVEGSIQSAVSALLDCSSPKATVAPISSRASSVRSLESPTPPRSSTSRAVADLIVPLVSLRPLGTTASPPAENATSALSTVYPTIKTSESRQMTLQASPISSTTSLMAPKESSLALGVVPPLVATAAPQTASPVLASLGHPEDVAGLGQLDPESDYGRLSSQAGGIIAGVLASVIVIAILITIYFCRRAKRKSHRRSIGGVDDSAPLFKPWKKRERELRDTIANLEGLLRQQDKPRNPENTRKAMIEITSEGVASYWYEEKATNMRPLTMPEPSFAPLRANRSSSLYSGSILNGFSANYFSPRARSTLLPPTRAGLRNSSVGNWFSPPEQRKVQPPPKTSQPQSDIYIARPDSTFDIGDGFGEKARRSASVPSTRSPSVLLSPFTDPRRDSGYSAASKHTTSTTITKVALALVTVRDLDAGVRLSSDVEQEHGYRRVDVVQEMKKEAIGASKLKNEIVMIVDEREAVESDDETVGRDSRGGLEDWEEREIERRRKEAEKARNYKGQIRAGMGVQRSVRERKAREMRQGVGVQRRWTRDSGFEVGR